MGIVGEVRGQLAARFEVLLPHLNERQQRLALATEARLLGHGGLRAVADAAGVSQSTVRKGVVELERGEDPLPVGRVRRAGGGRKRASEQDAELLPALLRLVEPDERGDPMSPPGVDDQVVAASGRGADRPRACGLGADGGQAAAGGRV